MKVLHEQTRWVFQSCRFGGPVTAYPVKVYVQDWPNTYTANGGPIRAIMLKTPWACLNYHGDPENITEEYIKRQTPSMYDSEADAMKAGRARYPFANRPNQQRLGLAIANWIDADGEFMGLGRLADKLGEDRTRLCDLARGVAKITRKQLALLEN